MIDPRIAEGCADALEVLLEELLEHAATTPIKVAPGAFCGCDPFLGRLFTSTEDHARLRFDICKALVADVRFRRETGMSLPLRREQIKALVDDDDPRLNIVGLYAGSQRGECWCPEHPSFAEFVSGVMAHDYAPLAIWEHRSLRQQFPPRRLEGMSDGVCDGLCLDLYWRSPETIAMLRDIDRMAEAAEAAGLIPPLRYVDA